jgi:hypothetical protein
MLETNLKPNPETWRYRNAEGSLANLKRLAPVLNQHDIAILMFKRSASEAGADTNMLNALRRYDNPEIEAVAFGFDNSLFRTQAACESSRSRWITLMSAN